MQTFTSREACELTAVVPVTLTKWVKNSIVAPVRLEGLNRTRHFTLTQVLGLHYVRLWSVIGGQGQLLKSIFEFFSSMNERKLEAEFKKGRIYVVVDPIGRVKLISTLDQDKELTYWIINVQRQLEHLKEKIDKLNKRK